MHSYFCRVPDRLPPAEMSAVGEVGVLAAARLLILWAGLGDLAGDDPLRAAPRSIKLREVNYLTLVYDLSIVRLGLYLFLHVLCHISTVLVLVYLCLFVAVPSCSAID